MPNGDITTESLALTPRHGSVCCWPNKIYLVGTVARATIHALNKRQTEMAFEEGDSVLKLRFYAPSR